ncbi:MAG: shikimate dehydrogenase [Clostridia bacterium]|nr:shikimate dehydrogenase [Clostridia bacterium]
MYDFSFMIHPMEADDLSKKFNFTKGISSKYLEKILRFFPPFKAGTIEGIKSKCTGKEISGFFAVCPLTTRQILGLPQELVLRKIINTGRMAEKQGSMLLGLGAMTAVVGDAGLTVSKELGIPVTTGNSYTIALAMEGAKKAAKKMGIDIAQAEVAVVGATGSIGAVCAKLMAMDCKYLTLVAQDKSKLNALARDIIYETGQAVRITSDLKGTLKEAQIVITVTSAMNTIIEPEDLAPGSVVCDVARPRDVARRVTEERKDVLVIEGGLAEIPGDVRSTLDMGYPENITFACTAETMILALEGKREGWTLGREISFNQVREIHELGKKHGFKLAGFRSFNRKLTEEDIRLIRKNGSLPGGSNAV